MRVGRDMDSNPVIKLPEKWISLAQSWASQMVDDYAAGHNARSRAVSCFDAHSNKELQAHAKMAECSCALWFGLDPEIDIHWGRRPDPDYDIKWRDKTFDIKATRRNGKYLLWPITKNEIFHSKNFDAMILVRGDIPYFEIAGWISKSEFFKQKKIATKDHKLFFGTWYVEDSELFNLDLLEMVAA